MEQLKEFYGNHGLDLTPYLERSSKQNFGSNDNGNINGMGFGLLRYRFVRLNPRFDTNETLDMLRQELKASNNNNNNNKTMNDDNDDENADDSEGTDIEPIPVPWLGKEWNFYALPVNFRLSASSCFQSGRIYGMDVSSGAGVAALLSTTHDNCHRRKEKEETNQNLNENSTSQPTPLRILDLCCCPGLKLCAMADYLAEQQKQKQRRQKHAESNNESIPTSTFTSTATKQIPAAVVIGVDISESRMALCKKIIQKYQIYSGTLTTNHFSTQTQQRKQIEQRQEQQQQMQQKQETDGGVKNGNGMHGNNDPKRNINDTRNKNNSDVTIQLYCQDGTTFGMNTTERNLIYDSRIAREDYLFSLSSTSSSKQQQLLQQQHGQRKRMNKSAKAREKKRLKQISTEGWTVSQPTSTSTSVGDVVANDDNDNGIDNGNGNGNDDNTGTNDSKNHPVIELFDHVLVDAECSTDGSLKHLQERLKSIKQEEDQDQEEETTTKSSSSSSSTTATSDNKNNNTTMTTPATNEKKKTKQQNSSSITKRYYDFISNEGQLMELYSLQKRLIESGYRLLKNGGTMVYSTCSLSINQNENIVQWLLNKYVDAYIIPVQFHATGMMTTDDDDDDDIGKDAHQHKNAKNKLVVEGTIPGTVRFYPNIGQNSVGLYGDGFFLAKIGKRKEIRK